MTRSGTRVCAWKRREDSVPFLAMDEQRRGRYIEVLLGALQHELTTRSAFLEDACRGDPELRARIETLIAKEPLVADFLKTLPPSPGQMQSTSESGKANPGAGTGREDLSCAIGRYLVREVLGEGGLGMVYLAEQEEPIRRVVALKLIKRGMDTEEVIARFESERQALALMDHPNVAKVFDAGMTEDGRPYFVMERVSGLPITAFADQRQLGLEDRLRLFLQACRGVQHAHAKGIIHRDIKPSNVLVADLGGAPVVKIIDFGIAKATNQRLTEKTLYTELGRVIGTPMYMSPEQAGLTAEGIDARTDVYSLGVLLYELLVGELPLDWDSARKAALDEVLRRIREETFPSPSSRWSRLSLERTAALSVKRRAVDPGTLARILRGELDWITMKCLERDRQRRYPSPEELALDVERFLDKRPVIARPASLGYLTRTWCRRNRTVVQAAAIVAIVLLAGLISSLSFAIIARSRLSEVLQLGDARRLRQLRERADELWPCRPERLEEMRRWISDCESLRASLEAHQNHLARLKGVGAELVDAARATLLWRIELLEELVKGIDELGHRDPRRGLEADMRQRMELASSLRERSIGRHRDAWGAAIRSIASTEECPRYGGLRITPQLGLVPLHRDPESGLWEFGQLFSGGLPSVVDGKLEAGGSACLVLVLIPGGRFRMGTDGTRLQAAEPTVGGLDPDEGPEHEVEIEPFFLSKFEMTQAQWERITGTNPSRFSPENPPETPVDSVGWDTARTVLARMDLVLPTECQWEYAARGGTSVPWWTGDAKTGVGNAENLADLALRAKNDQARAEDWNDGFGGPAPVGRFRPNPNGLYDVLGNVREWCRDRYAKDAYVRAAAPGDGERSAAEGPGYAIRGGSWATTAWKARCSERAYGEAPVHDLGVRPARVLEQ